MLQLSTTPSRVLESFECRKVHHTASPADARCAIWECFVTSLITLCIHADMSELNLAKGTTISFPDGKDKLLHFEIFLKPEEGIYK